MQPDDRHTLLGWSGQQLTQLSGERAEQLLAADSWLIEDGAVRGRDAHWERFGGWVRELDVPAASLEAFRVAVEALLPVRGRWFPRVELVGSGLRLRLRPAPPVRSEARVVVGPRGDPRTDPRRKGPDLDLLLALRARAVGAQAHELLLCDEDGRLVEGALTALLWWEGETLCTTPAERTLPSVTRALLLEIARGRGVALGVRSPLPRELTEVETWLVNAAHGIQVVSAWDGRPAAPAPRAEPWRAALDATAQGPAG